MTDHKLPVTAPTRNLPHAEYRRVVGTRKYDAIIEQLIPQTQRTIRIFDKSLSRAYTSPQRVDALRQFLLASRANRLMIVLHETGTVERDCPRMIELLRNFATAVKINGTLKPAKQVYDPFVIFDAT